MEYLTKGRSHGFHRLMALEPAKTSMVYWIVVSTHSGSRLNEGPTKTLPETRATMRKSAWWMFMGVQSGYKISPPPDIDGDFF